MLNCVLIFVTNGLKSAEMTFGDARLESPGRTKLGMLLLKSRRMRWAGHVACTGEERGVYRVLVGKPEGKRPLRRPRHRWVDNISMGLQEVGCGYMD